MDRPVAADTDFVIKVVSTFMLHTESLYILKDTIMLLEMLVYILQDALTAPCAVSRWQLLSCLGTIMHVEIVSSKVVFSCLVSTSC